MLKDPAQVTELNHVKAVCQLIVNRFEIWEDVTRIPCKTNLHASRKETQALDIRTVSSDVTSFIVCTITCTGHAVAQFGKALRYKLGGSGFDSCWCHNPSGPTMSAQLLTEMSTRKFTWRIKTAET